MKNRHKKPILATQVCIFFNAFFRYLVESWLIPSIILSYMSNILLALIVDLSKGSCPGCRSVVQWGDLVRRMRGCFKNLHQD